MLLFMEINSTLGLKVKFDETEKKSNCEGIYLSKDCIKARKLGQREGLDTLVVHVDNNGY